MTAVPRVAAGDGNGERLDTSHLALLAGTFAVTFDFFVVNPALPTIAVELGSSPALTQWIVAGIGIVMGPLIARSIAAAACHWVFAALSVVGFASTGWREWSRSE